MRSIFILAAVFFAGPAFSQSDLSLEAAKGIYETKRSEMAELVAGVDAEMQQALAAVNAQIEVLRQAREACRTFECAHSATEELRAAERQRTLQAQPFDARILALRTAFVREARRLVTLAFGFELRSAFLLIQRTNFLPMQAYETGDCSAWLDAGQVEPNCRVSVFELRYRAKFYRTTVVYGIGDTVQNVSRALDSLDTLFNSTVQDFLLNSVDNDILASVLFTSRATVGDINDYGSSFRFGTWADYSRLGAASMKVEIIE